MRAHLELRIIVADVIQLEVGKRRNLSVRAEIEGLGEKRVLFQNEVAPVLHLHVLSPAACLARCARRFVFDGDALNKVAADLTLEVFGVFTVGRDENDRGGDGDEKR